MAGLVTKTLTDSSNITFTIQLYDDGSGNLISANTQLSPFGVQSLDETVAAAGTPQQLNAGVSLGCVSVLILASQNNTGNIYVGGSTPTFPLAAGASITLHVSDVREIYANADVTGEGFHWIAETV